MLLEEKARRDSCTFVAADLPEPPVPGQVAGPGPVVVGDEMCRLLRLQAALAALCPFTGVLSCVVFHECVLHVEFTRPHPTAREIITFKTRTLNRPGGVNTLAVVDDSEDAGGQRGRSRLSGGWGLGLEAGGPRSLW